MNLDNVVLVDHKGSVHHFNNHMIEEIKPRTAYETKIANLITGSVTYFNTPFRSMVAFDDKKPISEWSMNPFTFHLLSPFNYLDEVKKYANSEMVYPLDLNITLTDRCNYRCTFCFNREKRESSRVRDLNFSTYVNTIDFFSSVQENLMQSLSTGGSGEAVIHPKFIQMLQYAKHKNIKTLLTTNGSRNDNEYIAVLAKCADVVIFSIHGVDENSFSQLQRPPKGVTLDKIIKTIAKIRKASQYIEREDMLSLRGLAAIHPLNAGHYGEFVERLIEAGINQISFNPILPNPAQHGIHIYDDIKAAMTEEFATLSRTYMESIVPIRIPNKPFKDDDATFFNSSARKNVDTCLISLLQPNIGPIYGEDVKSKFTACRFYPTITANPDYWYSGELGLKDVKDIWVIDNIRRIQEKATQCAECSSERTIMALDWMLTTIKQHPFAKFYLVYDPNIRSGLTNYSESVGGLTKN